MIMGFLRSLFRYLLITAALLAGVVVHIVLQDLLPAPFNRLNVVFILVLGLVVLFRDLRIIWVGIGLGFILEIFSVTPFGAIMISLLVGLWAGGWILLRLLSSHTFGVIFFATAVGIIVYRLVLSGLLWIFNLFGFFSFGLTTAAISAALIEAVLSGAVMAGLYFIGAQFIRRLRPEYVNTQQSFFYGRR